MFHSESRGKKYSNQNPFTVYYILTSLTHSLTQYIALLHSELVMQILSTLAACMITIPAIPPLNHSLTCSLKYWANDWITGVRWTMYVHWRRNAKGRFDAKGLRTATKKHPALVPGKFTIHINVAIGHRQQYAWPRFIVPSSCCAALTKYSPWRTIFELYFAPRCNARLHMPKIDIDKLQSEKMSCQILNSWNSTDCWVLKRTEWIESMRNKNEQEMFMDSWCLKLMLYYPKPLENQTIKPND